MNKAELDRWGIKNKNTLYNLRYISFYLTIILNSVPDLYERAIRKPVEADFNTLDTCLSSTGAIVSYSGLRTGRSPKDKRIVRDD